MRLDDLLADRYGLEGIRWALKGQTSRHRLRQALEALLEPPGQLGLLTLTRAKYKPRRRLTGYYDVKLPGLDASGLVSRPIAVDWQLYEGSGTSQPTEQAQAEAMEAEASQFNLVAPFRGLEASLPDQGFRIRISPLDVSFPQLVRLSNPVYVNDRLAPLEDGQKVPSSNRKAPVVTVTPIRYRPGERHVLRYDRIESREGSQSTYFAKLYSNPTDGPKRMRVAQRVADWLAECESIISGARPVGYLEEDHALIFPRISGEPLSYYLRRPKPWVSGYLWRAGAGLRSLHDGPQTLAGELELKSFDDEVRVIARASEHIHVLLPEAGARISEILEIARNLHTALLQEPPTFTHSDFKADHLRVTKNSLTLFDFDTCSLADPASDVGKFLADLQWWFFLYQQAGVEKAQEEVLSGYNFSGLEARLLRSRLYEALILVKITVRRVRLFDPNWAGLTNRLVDCAGQVIQRLAVDVS